MVLDYKGVSFSFKDRKKAKRLKQIRLVVLGLLVVFILFTALRLMDSGKIGNVQEQLLTGKRDEARSNFLAIKEDWFHKEAKKELMGLVHLYFAEYDEAQKAFDTLNEPANEIEGNTFLDYFAQHALYRALGVYTEFLAKSWLKTSKGNELLFYRGLYLSAKFDYIKSNEALSKLPVSLKEKHKKALALIKRNNAQVKAGAVKYIFDTDGKALAYFDTKTKQTVPMVPGFYCDDFNTDFSREFSFYSLTLDQGIQAKVHHLFQNKFGSFLLFNVTDSSILAAYSKLRGNDRPVNTVFTELYEPGSIIKLLTMLAFLKEHPDGQGTNGQMFPFQCNGYMQIEGKTFYDWTKHGEVESIDESLAMSCNLAFARMGMSLGHRTLNQFFTQFFFNREDLKDRFISFKTGKTADTISTEYQLANMSVGLDVVSISTFHAAYLSTLISQNGSAFPPYLIKNKKNLLGIPYDNREPRLLEVFKDNTAFFKVKNAMVYVVESQDGTGRRSRTDNVPVAMKTGTSGSKKNGLDSVLTGYFPADKPQYAFAFRLQGAGKAEWEGALFLKRFLTSFYGTQGAGSR